MAERSKWAEAGAIISMVTFLFGTIAGAALGGWATATYATTLSASVSSLSATVTELRNALAPVVAMFPAITLRLDNLERAMGDVRRDNAAQGSDISAVKQGLAVLSSTVDSMRHDVQALQDAANGRLPGGRR